MSIKPARTQKPATATLFAGQSSEYQAPGVHLIDEAFDAVLHFLRAGMTEEDAKEAARCAIASAWKGSRWYVSGRSDISARNAAIQAEFRRGEHISLLMRRHQLSAVQVWRIVNNVPNR